MWKFLKPPKVPEHWRSTDAQVARYLGSTGQAQMFKEQARTKRKSRPDGYLPAEPVESYEEANTRSSSLKKKLGAGVLAALTFAVPSSQYATESHHQPARAISIDMDDKFLEHCYDVTTSVPASNEVRTFVISDAHNDSLSETGRLTTSHEFDSSAAMLDLREYVRDMPTGATITEVQVHGMASDDNRSNVEAGIGRADEINQRTAASYASIATTAIKKLLGTRSDAVTFTQSAEEKLFTEEEKQAFEEARQEAAVATNADLLTAYNDVQSALDEQSRATLDTMISQHRGVEITLHSATPEQTIIETSCVPITQIASSSPAEGGQAGAGTAWAGPVAVLPTLSRPRPAPVEKTEGPRVSTFKDRLKWRAGAFVDTIKRDGETFVEDIQLLAGGVANAGRAGANDVTNLVSTQYKKWVSNEPGKLAAADERRYSSTSYTPRTPQTRTEQLIRPVAEATGNFKEQVSHVGTVAPEGLKRFLRHQRAQLGETRQSARRTIHDVRMKQVTLNRLAQIPAEDARLLPNEFYQRHGVFRDEYIEKRPTGASRVLRKALRNLSTRSKE